LPIES